MQVQPELRFDAEPVAEPQRRIARHGTLAGDDLADAIRRHVDLAILAALGVVLLASPLLWASPAGESAAADDGRLTLWFMKTDNGRPLPAEVHMNDNPWTQVLAEGLPHIDITWLLIPEETFAEQKNIMIAAGDIPDMFPVSHNEMPKWADSGLIRPLDDLVAEHYPNQDEFFDQDTWDNAFRTFAFYSGQQYRLLVPQNSHGNQQVLLLRKDWLDKLGLGVPESLDDLMMTCSGRRS